MTFEKAVVEDLKAIRDASLKRDQILYFISFIQFLIIFILAIKEFK